MAGKTDVIVIGGGAAGMTAAIACARQAYLEGKKKKIILLEHNEKLGRKLLATGNGKCNYTNRLQNMDCYRGTDKAEIEVVLSQFDAEAALSFFQGLGIYPKEKNGYFYPFSEQAAAVVEAMRLELEHLAVTIKCSEHIVSLKKQENEFLVSTETYTYRADKVIVATGGLAASKLGSDGSGYPFAKNMGLSVTKLYPALTGLKTREDMKALAGVRVKASLTLLIEEAESSKESNASKKKAKSYRESGELQLASYGISGIPVFQLSRFAAEAMDQGKRVTAEIDFLPKLSEQELFELCIKLKQQNFYKTAGTLFNGLLDSKLTVFLLKKASIDKNKKAEELTDKELSAFCRCIKEFMCAIIDTNGFENAQATAGGVRLSELEPTTLEAKRIKGLYFAGELLDADGICGGYNLQWAWATGYLAGTAAGK